jgi:hypothetical protein
VTSISGTTSSKTLQLNFTSGTVLNFRVNYLVSLSNFCFLDVQNSYQDLTALGTIFSSAIASTRTTTLTLPYKGKSNSSNTVMAYTTVGLSMMRQKNSFDFTLTTNTLSTTTFTVDLTLPANNGMRFIRISIVNYENIPGLVSSPDYIDMGFLSTLSGSVPDSSGLGLTTTGTIMTGMTDWTLSDSFAVINYNMTLSTLSYSIISTSVSRSKTGFVWYREKTCPTYYFDSSGTC